MLTACLRCRARTCGSPTGWMWPQIKSVRSSPPHFPLPCFFLLLRESRAQLWQSGSKTFTSGLCKNNDSDCLLRASCRETVEGKGEKSGLRSQTCSEHSPEVLNNLYPPSVPSAVKWGYVHHRTFWILNESMYMRCLEKRWCVNVI